MLSEIINPIFAFFILIAALVTILHAFFWVAKLFEPQPKLLRDEHIHIFQKRKVLKAAVNERVKAI